MVWLSASVHDCYYNTHTTNIPTGKCNHKSADVTKEMARHGLLQDNLQSIMSNPSQTEWELKSTPSLLFYYDLHDTLKKNRIPMEEIGMIYRSIDPRLRQETTTNKQAYIRVQNLISKYKKQSISGSDDDNDEEDSSSNEVSNVTPNNPCTIRTVVRRERRAKARIKALQQSLRQSKKKNNIQEEKIEQLSAALKETRTLVCERNAQITHLQKTIQQLEQAIEVLHTELDEINQQAEEELEKHEDEIIELEDQIHHLQKKMPV